MEYTDGFPWLKWSRHFTGETSVRVKLIEPYNLLSTVLTVALWFGNNDYETTKKCGRAVYKQLKELKTVKHPLTGQEIKIIRRTCGDGKEGRYLLAVHLPNPLIQSQKPQSTRATRSSVQYQFGQFQMQRVARKKLRLNCAEKPPPKKSAESFPNKILGTLGVKI